MRKFWTPEYLAWLAAAYRQHRIAAIPSLFQAHFGIAVSESSVKSAIMAHRLPSGRPKGLLPGERPGPTWNPERLAWLRVHRADLPIRPLTAGPDPDGATQEAQFIAAGASALPYPPRLNPASTAWSAPYAETPGPAGR